MPQHAPSAANNDFVPATARTRGLTDSVASPTHDASPSETEGEGFRRLRDQAMQIRAHVERQQEAGESKNGTASPTCGLRAHTRGRPPGSKEERDQITAYLADFARELHDQAPLSSSVSRALTSFHAASVPRERWGNYLDQTRSTTQQRCVNITKRNDTQERLIPVKNTMAYSFSVLDYLITVKSTSPSPHASRPLP